MCPSKPNDCFDTENVDLEMDEEKTVSTKNLMTGDSCRIYINPHKSEDRRMLRNLAGGKRGGADKEKRNPNQTKA